MYWYVMVLQLLDRLVFFVIYGFRQQIRCLAASLWTRDVSLWAVRVVDAFLGFLVSWFQSLLVSWFQSFKDLPTFHSMFSGRS